MSTYSGNLIKRYGKEWYHTEIDGIHWRHICAGCAHAILGGDHDSCPESMAWGYEGYGPDMLSAALIAMATDSDYWFNMERFTQRAIERVTRHHKAFTSEITSKFGDSWTITDNEIRTWLLEKEKEAFQSQSNNTK